jgi:Fe(3+) dicitrate transport protein
MKLKDFNIIILLLLVSLQSFGQFKYQGEVTDLLSGSKLSEVQIYDKLRGSITKTNLNGNFEFISEHKKLTLVFFLPNYEVLEKNVNNIDSNFEIILAPLQETLDEIEIITRKRQIFELKRLNDVEETAIYAGKKTEVVLLEGSMANLATNNARQIFSQVAGLNIYQNDDAGLQLNIGGRGLDPNRTSNFNTRQNGYDISADVLGYPESYYAPPAEALKEIQVIRGAAALQYGTQFGGLVNFVFKSPNSDKVIELTTRNTIGSNRLYTNFTSLSGTSNKWSYFTFLNYKKGDGFRPNSNFESFNLFAKVGYQINDTSRLSGEITYMNYLAQQAGGLTDNMFENDPFQSNRTRNWFEVDWLLYNLKFSKTFKNDADFTFSFFGLNALRNAIGFRTNRSDQIDSMEERDLIKGKFQNFGFEARYLNTYKIKSKDATFLIGSKFYKAYNKNIQGPGTNSSDANFNIQTDVYPNYPNQSDYTLPNLNLSLFGENIFYVNDKLSLTPGFRLEYIKTESDGYYKKITIRDGDLVYDNQTIYEQDEREREFILLGLGASYKPNKFIEYYANVSQNYRSVTFSDISIVNPAYIINPNITDEKGFTFDTGIRGKFKTLFSYDVTAFSLLYQNRIGFIQKATPQGVKSERGNVGDAIMYGIESLVDFNLSRVVFNDNAFTLNTFINLSLIDSKYLNSLTPGLKGNKVEFVPNTNFKTGLKLGYKNFLTNLQFTYLSSQFTDASNAVSGGLSGVIGKIPSYHILDLSASYIYKNLKLELGVNNATNNFYFTRRATGYPGPGIIPSPNRNFYTTLEFKF